MLSVRRRARGLPRCALRWRAKRPLGLSSVLTPSSVRSRSSSEPTAPCWVASGSSPSSSYGRGPTAPRTSRCARASCSAGSLRSCPALALMYGVGPLPNGFRALTRCADDARRRASRDRPCVRARSRGPMDHRRHARRRPTRIMAEAQIDDDFRVFGDELPAQDRPSACSRLGGTILPSRKFLGAGSLRRSRKPRRSRRS